MLCFISVRMISDFLISLNSLASFSSIAHVLLYFLDRQIDRDCEFLEAERIMDYSLLVGLHFRDENTGDKMGLSPFLLRTGKFTNQFPVPVSQ